MTQKKRIFSSVGDFDKTFSWLSGDSLRTNRDSCIQVAFAKSSIFPVPDLDNFINFMLTKKAINLMQRLCRSHILTPFLFLATDLIGTSFIPTRKQLPLQSSGLFHLHILADAQPFLGNRQHRSWCLKVWLSELSSVSPSILSNLSLPSSPLSYKV